MKVVIIGDIHGRDYWKKIVEYEKPDKLVFIGDYFDSFNIDGKEQIQNFKDIIDFKTDPVNIDVCETIMLIGNHDYHYFKFIGDNGTIGFQKKYAMKIGELLEKNFKHLQMCYEIKKGVVCSHAGITMTFLQEMLNIHPDLESINTISDLVNDIWEAKPFTFAFKDLGSSTDHYGNNKEQSCIWVRPESLLTDTLPNTLQIVGHTGMRAIQYPPIHLHLNDSYFFFIDTIGSSSSGEYLIYDDSKEEPFSVNSWKNY